LISFVARWSIIKRTAGLFRGDKLVLRLTFLGEVFESFFDFLAQVHHVEGLADEIERAEIHSLGG
jgi:hypothetical protein